MREIIAFGVFRERVSVEVQERFITGGLAYWIKILRTFASCDNQDLEDRK